MTVVTVVTEVTVVIKQLCTIQIQQKKNLPKKLVYYKISASKLV